MHCIAKTLLTELHLAILVPASVCLRNCPAPAPAIRFPSSALPPPPPPCRSFLSSALLRRHLRPSFLRYGIPGARVYAYARSRSIRLREIPARDGGELMARAGARAGGGMAGRRTGRTEDGAARMGLDSESRRTASLNP